MVTIWHSDGTVTETTVYSVAIYPGGVWVERVFYPMHTITQIETGPNVISASIMQNG